MSFVLSGGIYFLTSGRLREIGGTFVGTSKHAVKSQILVSLIVYLLLELIRRVYCKSKSAFSNFCEKVRICLLH